MFRMVEWSVEVLYGLLQTLAAERQRHTFQEGFEPQSSVTKVGSVVVDELVPILEMPEFDEVRTNRRKEANSVVLPSKVRDQLHLFVLNIANTYRDVPFHNFYHATHVIMSSSKLLKRVVEPDNVDYKTDTAQKQIHDSTYGISSDPLMLFTILFSVLIHDADHTGLTNAELVAVDDSLAKIYLNKSVAEQNSVDMAWRILHEPRFSDLCACIYTNNDELRRVRQLLVNAVIATDIADK